MKEINDEEYHLFRCAVAALDEAKRVRAKWSAFHSYHEGYAVILEELDELWDECKKKEPDKQKLAEEAIQVAAMALRFIAELTTK